LPHWPAAGPVVHEGLTTVGNWRGYGSIEHGGVFYGQKAHSLRKLITLPKRTPEQFLLALAIHPDERKDLAALADEIRAFIVQAVAVNSGHLGSNLGEISRAARARGAALVDGYEYDPFFVEMAQVLDAYNGTTGVSFFQRDITDPEIYVDHYDLVLAFSVFTYIHPVLERLAEITDEALVVETHKLDGNLDKGYLAPVRRFLPIYKVLGESDWGRALPANERRAVVVFARDEACLARSLGRVSRSSRCSINVQRTTLQRAFFDSAKFPDGEALLDEVRSLEIDLDRVAHEDDLSKAVYSGRTYWQIFLKGYCQYLDGRLLGPGNIYYDYIVKFYAPRGHDPGVADALRDPLFALHRIASRFRDLDQFRQAPRKYVPAPVRLFQSGDSTRDRLVLYDAADGEPIRAARVDGWHRLFAARVFGATRIPGEVVESPLP